MRESAVIRQTAAGLCWYPPGASSAPRRLDSEAEFEQLKAMASGRSALIFAAPGTPLRLQEVEYSAAEKRHIAKSLPFLLEEEFASDIEELHFASVSLGRERLGVVSCAHDTMQAWSEQLDEIAPTARWIPEPLLLPWREGEDWFWDTLLDADLANNASGWQWVAGSGADAAPYFRIFNPTLQGEKFDGAGEYVRHWVPEIAALPDRFLHRPAEAPSDLLDAAGIELGVDYPLPIVDHKQARESALAAYKTTADA